VDWERCPAALGLELELGPGPAEYGLAGEEAAA
jgi:hypothetical protein